MKSRFMDIHHHLLYGMDDGPKDCRKMYAMLRRAASQGISRIVATPHITPGVYHFDRSQYDLALREAADYCSRMGLNIALYEGAEILYTGQTCRLLREGKVPTLAGTDRVLVEFSPDVRFEELHEALDHLLCSGYLPVVAHVERYRCLVMHPARAERLKREMTVYFQVNCGAILDDRGFFERRFINRLMRKHLIDAVATDAHNTSSRSARMYDAWRELKFEYGASYARRLTDGSLLYG